MAQFLMAIGIPASGKSSYGDILRNKDFGVIISSDAIREEIFHDVNDQNHNGEVFNIMFKRAVEALNNNQNCYYDATNLSAKRRINLIKEIKNNVKDKIDFSCIIFAVPYEKCFMLNKVRNRVVPQQVMERMLKSFEPPHYSEGWNNIYIYESSGNEKNLLLEKIHLLYQSHDNPHHSLSIGEHMEEALALYWDSLIIKNNMFNFDKNISKAIEYHDIGKGYCKVFHNIKKEPSKIAHYYNHENVGSYFYLSNCNLKSNSLNDIVEVANLIAHHMDFFKGEKYLDKIKLRFGEEFFAKLQIVHKFDVAAH